VSAGTLVTASGVAKRYSHRVPSVLEGVSGRLMALVLSVPADGLAASAPRPVRPVTREVSPAMYTVREPPRSRAAGTLARARLESRSEHGLGPLPRR